MAMDPNGQANDPAMERSDPPDNRFDRTDSDLDGRTSSVSRTSLDDQNASGVSRRDDLSTADLASASAPATLERDQTGQANAGQANAGPAAGDREPERAGADAQTRSDQASSWANTAPPTSAAAAGVEHPQQSGQSGRSGSDGSAGGDGAAPLFPENEAQQFRDRWLDLQASFVDEPRQAVQLADSLVAEVIKRLAQSFADERSGLEHQWDRGEQVSTEDLRVALRRYRSFFDRLLSV